MTYEQDEPMSGAAWMLRHHVTARVSQIDRRPDADDLGDWHDEATHWRVEYRYSRDDHPTRGRVAVHYSQGPAHEHAPTAGAVLECVALDLSAGEQSFADFCADFGYDEDSRRAHATWCAVVKQCERWERFCSHIGGTAWDDLYNVSEDA